VLLEVTRSRLLRGLCAACASPGDGGAGGEQRLQGLISWGAISRLHPTLDVRLRLSVSIERSEGDAHPASQRRAPCT
jgi:hypothetical protein